MTPEPFSAEQWMTAYEQQAVYNLTDTSCQTLTMQDLCQWDPEFLQDIQLDYGDISGSDAVKDRILKLYASGERENVTVTAGCVNANRHVMDALLEEGDHVIAFAPGYQQYTAYPRSLGCDVTEVDYDLEQVKAAIRPETKMLILSSPANPTGFQVTDWQPWIDICRPLGIWILCDEVYRGIGPAAPSVSDLYQRGAATGSLSKCWGVPALRFGWVKGCRELVERVNRLRDYSMICQGPLLDRLACRVLDLSADILAANNETVQINKEQLRLWLLDNPAFSCDIPEAGPVGFLKVPWKDSRKAALQLLEEYGLFFVPGECFCRPGWFRIGFGKSVKSMKTGLEVLSKVTKL